MSTKDILKTEYKDEEERLTKLDGDSAKYQEDGNQLNALECLEAALVLRKSTYGVESEQVKSTSMKLCKLCNLLSMTQLDQENFALAFDLLKKAEILSEHSRQGRAVTQNNLACYYRRMGKLRASLKYLEKALNIESALEQRGSNPSDTHLNICAVLSLLGRHNDALRHAMQALILLQEELLQRVLAQNKLDAPFADRAAVLVIAQHNMGVQQEFLGKYDDALLSYSKAVDFATQHLGDKSKITENVTDVFNAAKKQIETIQINKWKRQQKNLNPVRRDQAYKELEEHQKHMMNSPLRHPVSKSSSSAKINKNIASEEKLKNLNVENENDKK